MKFLAIGDLVGENGLAKLEGVLPRIQEENNIDFTILNGENAAGGVGMTTKIYDKLCKLNIQVITMGNHTWGKKDIFTFIDNDNIIRPANYSDGLPGKGYRIFEKYNKTIAVINLIGRTDMGVLSNNPFQCIDKLLEEIKADIIIVDFHAEATAEKIAMGYYLDGRVNTLFGTHTHVQTADEKILEKGTAFITDIGMTGPIKSVIGMDIDASLKRFITSLPEKYKLADGKCSFNGIVFEVDDETNKTKSIRRIKA